MKVNYSYLSSGSPYRNAVSSALGAWNYPDRAIKAQCLYESSFSNSTVDILTASSDAWKSWGKSSKVVAFTIPTDTYGRKIYGESDCLNSTGQLKYAAIYVNPNNGTELDSDYRKVVLAHEIGHAWGLAHANVESESSIMVQGKFSWITCKLYDHDINDMIRYYGAP